MTDVSTRGAITKGSPWANAKGAITITVSTVVLFIVSAVFAPSSVSGGVIQGMLPFAAVLAIVGLGQMLVPASKRKKLDNRIHAGRAAGS